MKLTEKGILHISKLDIKMTSCHYLKKKTVSVMLIGLKNSETVIMQEQLSVKYWQVVHISFYCSRMCTVFTLFRIHDFLTTAF